MSSEHRPRILCVDDDRSMLAWTEIALEGLGWDVATEADPCRAVVRAQTDQPDLIILDITMPEVSGYQICEELQKRPETAYIPVLFVTRLDGEKDRTNAFLVGGVDCLRKPLKEEVLVAAVKSHLATRRRFCEVRELADMGPPPDARGRRPDTRRRRPDTKGRRPDRGRRWDDGLRGQSFVRFREALAKRALSPEKAKALSHLLPGSLYIGAAELGVSARELAELLAETLGLPFLARIEPERVRLGILPTPFCLSNQVLPLADDGAGPAFVLSNPFNWEVIEAVRRCAESGTIRLSIAEPAAFEVLRDTRARALAAPPAPATKSATLAESYAAVQRELEADAVETLRLLRSPTEESGPLIELVNQLIESAYESGASDIHIEPSETDVTVRFRIDGDLHVVNRFQPAELHKRLIARLKVMSSLDVTEHRLPQDGRIVFKKYSRKNHGFDLRVAIAPVNFGEKAVMRILDKQKSVLPLEKLGFSARNLALYRETIRQPYGMVLHVGPTGSGKSMSLYAALNEIKDPTVNVQTAEDPIEYTLPGISQMQMNPEMGLTFGRALRTLLRMDPDVILVGEIRDPETAKIAVEASLTGHLVLSTLHTNDSAATVTRFMEMGVEPFLVGTSVNMICAQRLLRRLCPDCSEPYEPTAEERRIVGMLPEEDTRLRRPRGCGKCRSLGYCGRTAVHEILVPNESLRKAINRKGVDSDTLKKMAVEECGLVTLYWDAMDRVRQGVCSVADALQNVRRDAFESRPPCSAT